MEPILPMIHPQLLWAEVLLKEVLLQKGVWFKYIPNEHPWPLQLQVQTSLSLVIDSTLCFYWSFLRKLKHQSANHQLHQGSLSKWWLIFPNLDVLGYGSILISSISSKLGGRCIFGRHRLGIRGMLHSINSWGLPETACDSHRSWKPSHDAPLIPSSATYNHPWREILC